MALYKLALWGQELFDCALAPLGLKTRHFAVLANLARGPSLSRQALGLKLGIDRSTLVKITDDLERLGLVTRCPHLGDRRVHILQATGSGRAVAADADRLLTDVESRIFAPLTAAGRETMEALLDHLLDTENAPRAHSREPSS